MSTPGSWPSPEDATGITPDRAFGLLGNATRLGILRALWEAQEPFADAGLTFSELRHRAGVEDSGQFNYHLEQLVGRFVTHEGDTYRLSFAGETVVRAVIAGTVTSDLSADPVEVDADCMYCGAPVTVQYRGGFVYVACTSCDGSVKSELVPGGLVGFELPPAGFADRSPQAVLEATLGYELPRYDARIEGVCPDCGGRVDSWLEVCEDHPETGYCDACRWRDRSRVRWLCRSCRAARDGPGYAVAIHHPATSAFLHDHGVELRRGSWAFVSLAGRVTETAVSTDPVRVTYTLDYGGDTLEFEVDADATVVSVGG